jgi:hypothetical protein
MKTIFSFSLGMFGIFSLSAQTVLQITHNLYRAGDEIVKQQVEYKDPGRSGENVLWDFSQLQVTNPEYTLSYHSPRVSDDNTFILGLDTFSVKQADPKDFIIGYEHFTAYFYQLKDDRLFQLGHANAVSQMRHEKPLLVNPFPFAYGQKMEDNYHSLTLYAGARPMQIEGDVQVEADAYGMMILPSKDTLRNVMRVKTIRTIIELPDTALVRKHTARNLPLPELMNTRIENYLWYEKGYRYPVFETIRHFNENGNDSTAGEFFSTAFFYPPQSHYYLEDDEENLAIVEKDNRGKNKEDDPLLGTTFNAFPNPVSTTLDVEIYLPVDARIKIQTRSVMNRSVYINENKGKFKEGTHKFQLNVTSLPPGFYLLNIWADNYLLSETVLKK